MLPAHPHVVLKSKNDYKIPSLLSMPSPPTSPRLRQTFTNHITEKSGLVGQPAGKKEIKTKSYVEQYRNQAQRRGPGVNVKRIPVRIEGSNTPPPRIWNQNPAAKQPKKTVIVSEPVKLRHLCKTKNLIKDIIKPASNPVKDAEILDSDQSKLVMNEILHTPAAPLVRSKCDLPSSLPEVMFSNNCVRDHNNNIVEEPGTSTISLQKKDDLILLSKPEAEETPTSSSRVQLKEFPQIKTVSKTELSANMSHIKSTTSIHGHGTNVTMEMTVVVDTESYNPSIALPVVQSRTMMLPEAVPSVPDFQNPVVTVVTVKSVESTTDTSIRASTADLNAEIETTRIQEPQGAGSKTSVAPIITSDDAVGDIQPIQLNLPEEHAVQKQSTPSILKIPKSDLELSIQNRMLESQVVTTEINDTTVDEVSEKALDDVGTQYPIQSLDEVQVDPIVNDSPIIKTEVSQVEVKTVHPVNVLKKQQKISHKAPQSSEIRTESISYPKKLNRFVNSCGDCRSRTSTLIPQPLNSPKVSKQNVTRRLLKSCNKPPESESSPVTVPNKKPQAPKVSQVENPERIAGPVNKFSMEIDKMAPTSSRDGLFEFPLKEIITCDMNDQDKSLVFSSIVLLYRAGNHMAGMLRLTNQSSQGVFYRVSSASVHPDRYTLEPKEGKLDPYKRVLIKFTTETVMQESEFREDIFKIEFVMSHATTYTSPRRFWMNVDPTKIGTAFTSCIILYHPQDPFFRACVLHSKSKLKKYVEMKRGTVLRVTLKEILQDIEIAQKELNHIRSMELVNLGISCSIAFLSCFLMWYHLNWMPVSN